MKVEANDYFLNENDKEVVRGLVELYSNAIKRGVGEAREYLFWMDTELKYEISKGLSPNGSKPDLRKIRIESVAFRYIRMSFPESS